MARYTEKVASPRNDATSLKGLASHCCSITLISTMLGGVVTQVMRVATPSGHVAGEIVRGLLARGPAARNPQRNVMRVASCLPWAKPARAEGTRVARSIWFVPIAARESASGVITST
jgi:hypothetical protein